MTFRFTRALLPFFLLVAGLCHGADEPSPAAALQPEQAAAGSCGNAPLLPQARQPRDCPATATATPVASPRPPCRKPRSRHEFQRPLRPPSPRRQKHLGRC